MSTKKPYTRQPLTGILALARLSTSTNLRLVDPPELAFSHDARRNISCVRGHVSLASAHAYAYGDARHNHFP